mmetsp:Transcript_22551/g.63171  ORF Transcript_22551/g.63171 Transcript_22551/m.63171 type:complete len:330 (-) Transcript_22551:142-1131(-)
MASAPGAEADGTLRAKAEEKCEVVQAMIRQIEKALSKNGEQERQWLQTVIDRKSPCFQTLLLLLVEPKYKAFVPLRCVALRAIQIILRIATQMQQDPDANVGMWCLVDRAGEDLANQVFREVAAMAEGPGAGEEQQPPLVACNALLVLGELGPAVLRPPLVLRLLDLFDALPERASDLVEVALRVHAWGGKPRATLLAAVVEHPGGKLLCEVLLQVINRADERRRLRALKVLAGCLAQPGSDGLLYTNDVRVLVEILLRELPAHATDAAAFACHAECFKAVAARCGAARAHRRGDVLQVLGDLSQDEQSEPAVRGQCAEMLDAMGPGGA